LKTTNNEEKKQGKEAKEEEEEEEDEEGFIKRGTIFIATGGKRKFAALKFPRLCPLVILAKILRNAELPSPTPLSPNSTLSRTAFIFFKIPRHRPLVQVRAVLRRMSMEQY
jgi:hypothetical protein